MPSPLSSLLKGGEWKSIYISRRSRPHPISDQKGDEAGDEAAAADGRGRTSLFTREPPPSHLKLNSKEAARLVDPTIHLFLQLSRGDDDGG